jgi:hypothetical protein
MLQVAGDLGVEARGSRERSKSGKETVSTAATTTGFKSSNGQVWFQGLLAEDQEGDSQ